MARQFKPYEPELHKLSSGTSESPSSPYPRGGTPLSFKPNVNRAKTKRWVEAKKYSYDGNDWGDDEYGEYDDDETPPLPQPSSMNQSTGDIPSMFTRDVTRPPLPSMDRSRSMDHVATLDAAGAQAQRTMSTDRITVDPTTRTVPIVRPAEIYKRMRAESAARQQASDPGYFVENPGAAPPVEPVSQDMSTSHTEQQGAASTGDRMLHPTPGGAERLSDIESMPHGSTSGNTPPIIKLPDMKRLSGFNPDLSLGTPSTAPVEPGSAAQQHQLQHNPSLGFRSVVHQAFDVPETPSTTVDSIARSNSDSTSVISPIIAQRNPSEIKTPTIVEEPESITTPKEDPNMVFKPGHRRDLSLPSPNNSPSRTPVITSVEGAAPSVVGEMSTETPSELPPNIRATSQKAAVQLPQAGKDLPAPLSVGISHPSEPTITTGDGVPVIIPSPSAENSPQDMESDRLRKEIIRSLSRENTPSEDPDHEDELRPEAPRQDSSSMLDEYERFWTKGSMLPSQDVEQPAPEYSSPSATSQDSPAPPAPLVPGPGPSAQASKPKLARRFSWESSSSGEPAPEPGVQSPPAPMPGQFPAPNEAETSPEEPAPHETIVEDHEKSEPPSMEKPKLTIVPPIPDNRSIISDGHLPEVYNAEAIPDSHADETLPAGPDRRASRDVLTAPATIEPTLLGFRDILGMKTSEDRVRAFNETRAKFGTIDTGLNQWLSFTVHTHPEHHDVVEKSTKLSTSGPKAPVSRGKFPKLAALGKTDLAPSGSGHVRRPSAPLGAMMNKQQVEQRGKELLHTAGVLGGRAGEAAKGFFARGRSKLKGGGNDKVDS
ncbi:hypothetical protein BO94DRAFT_540212 [Aspergillus sclerotioniger CBS 115572]|uniref:Uncharacterized protein n=1 Tax=Aspergillus sclerotioniger CBS 115572 TaxID=1450535 RepID=A0A317V372_9EURO|nr:hypothetical protein BO94DRAFT_540212 [Aspergillus sclerotioniger CBS 115572]PWY68535.1 hypothetical protein BO94DRAFT_540212 [Aspergillus sclerotioniger CBS 115572]